MKDNLAKFMKVTNKEEYEGTDFYSSKGANISNANSRARTAVKKDNKLSFEDLMSTARSQPCCVSLFTIGDSVYAAAPTNNETGEIMPAVALVPKYGKTQGSRFWANLLGAAKGASLDDLEAITTKYLDS